MIAGAREAHSLHVCLLVNSNREGISIQTGSGLLLPSKKKKKDKKGKKRRQKSPRGTERLPQTIELAWQL